MNFKGCADNLFNARIKLFAKPCNWNVMCYQRLYKRINNISKYGSHSINAMDHIIPLVSRCQRTILLKMEVIVESAKRSMLRMLKCRLNLSDNMLLWIKINLCKFNSYLFSLIYQNILYYQIWQHLPASIWRSHCSNHLHIDQLHGEELFVIIPRLDWNQ